MSESIRFVLTKPRPLAPVHNSIKEAKEAHTRCVASNNKAITYMMASMTYNLRAKLESMKTVVDILDVVQGMFGKKNE